jgi:hypothetical protein
MKNKSKKNSKNTVNRTLTSLLCAHLEVQGKKETYLSRETGIQGGRGVYFPSFRFSGPSSSVYFPCVGVWVASLQRFLLEPINLAKKKEKRS